MSPDRPAPRERADRRIQRILEPLPLDPADAARAAHLRYVDDSGPGIRRVRCGKNGFRYVDPAGKPVRDERTLERIRGIVIPPAWTAVCRRCYVHPAVLEAYSAGRLAEALVGRDAAVKQAMDRADAALDAAGAALGQAVDALTEAEEAVLALLRDATPRDATPRPATPRAATPHVATPRDATPALAKAA